MTDWTDETEEILTLLIKDWLKSQGHTQADLGKALNSGSSRMPALIEIIKAEHKAGGMIYVAKKLCAIEDSWNKKEENESNDKSLKDPFGQLDLILQELREKSHGDNYNGSTE